LLPLLGRPLCRGYISVHHQGRLINGKEGTGSLTGSSFQLPQAAQEKSPTLALYHNDATSDMLVMR
jgi:hypothetical protein